MSDGLNEFIKSMQAGLHDQIGALKYDTTSAISDAKAALDLVAEMESKVSEVTEDRQRFQELVKFMDIIVKWSANVDLEIRRNRALVAIHSMCSRIYIKALILSTTEERGSQEQLRFLGEAFIARFTVENEFEEKIREVTKEEDFNPIFEQFVDKFISMQESLKEYIGKRLKEV